jgi:hypothetical protein
VEQQVRLKTDHFRARGKIDLAFRKDDGSIVVCDWKMGRPHSVDDSLQLLFYALWAVEDQQYSPTQVSICKAFLENEVISTTHVSDQDLRRVNARIIQDLEMMKSLEDYGSSSVGEAFTPCEQARVCELCPFQGVCLEELD